MSITSAVTVLISAAETDSTFPRGADLHLIIRSAPSGITSRMLAEEFEGLRPQFVESSLDGTLIHSPSEAPDGSTMTWNLPLGTATTLSPGTYPDAATGVMTLDGDVAEMAQAVRRLDDQGYEVIATFRTSDRDLPPWIDPPLGPITFLAFLCSVGSMTLLHLNRRVAAVAIEQTLGGGRMRARMLDLLSLACWAAAVTAMVGLLEIAAVGMFSAGALSATGVVRLLLDTLLLQGFGIAVAMIAAMLAGELLAAPLVERLRSVAPQAPIIWTSGAAIALFTATALVIAPVAVNAYQQMRSSMQVGDQWKDVPDVVAVSLFALSDADLSESSPAIREVIQENAREGSAVLNAPDDQCEMVAVGLGGDCVLHLNDDFFTLAGQDPDRFGLPGTSGETLIVSIPRSREPDRARIERTAKEWASFEAGADCAIAATECEEEATPPRVRVVTYEDGETMESFTANSTLQGGPAEYRDPVIYYYALDAPWLSAVNSLAEVSGGGISFTRSVAEVRAQWEEHGLRDIVADIGSARESALVVAQQQQSNALVNGSRVLIALVVAAMSVAILAAAECRRQHDRLLATFMLGRGWSVRHRRFLAMAALSLSVGLLVAIGMRGTERVAVLVLWAVTLAALMLIAALTVTRFDRRIRGDSLKER